MSRPFRILLILLIGLTNSSFSQSYPSGARAIALSNAFVSISDTWSTFHNQACIANAQHFSAGLFYESKFGIKELALASGTVIVPTKKGSFGFSFYQLGHHTFKEHKIGLAYARQLSSRLNAALQLDYFSKRFPENENPVGFPTFEIGLSYQASEKVRLGAHIFNPVKNGFDTFNGKQKLPLIFRMGGHCQFSNHVLISGEVQQTEGEQTQVKAGLEFSPLSNLSLRLGVSGRPVNYSMGLGYTLKKVSTNLAFSYHGNLGFTPSVSLQYNIW